MSTSSLGMPERRLFAGGERVSVASLDELRQLLAHRAAEASASFALFVGELPEHNFSLLTTPARSVIFYTRGIDRESYSSRGELGGDEEIDFLQDNGQVDPFDISWTIPTDVAIEAFCYFYDYLHLPDFVNWHRDF